MSKRKCPFVNGAPAKISCLGGKTCSKSTLDFSWKKLLHDPARGKAAKPGSATPPKTANGDILCGFCERSCSSLPLTCESCQQMFCDSCATSLFRTEYGTQQWGKCFTCYI